VLKPGEVNSENGEQFALEEDGSIFVSGPIPQRAVYTIRWRTEVPEVACLRIETLPDARLTNKGAGRATNGNFHLTELTLAIEPQEPGGMATPIEMADVLADDQTSDDFNAANIIDGNPNTRWDTYPRHSTRHAVVLKLKSPIRTTDKELTLTLDSGVFEYGPHALGRFRLSISGDPAAFARQQKLFAAMMITDPWAKLAAAYHAIGDQQTLDKLLDRHPSAAAGIGDLYAADKNWEQAIAAYSKLIFDQTTDASLFVKRGEAYFASQQLDLARADWRRAVALRPELAQSQFDRLRQAERWNEAAPFGLELAQQKRNDLLEDSLVWLRIAPVLASADDPRIYSDFCSRMVQHFAASKLPEVHDRVIKAALLRPNSINLAKLPGDQLAKSLDDGTAPEWLSPWAWASRALLAYRRGDAESAVQYLAKSEEYKPIDLTHAMNLAVLTMAQHQLGKPDEAKTALEEASKLITRLKEDPGRKGDFDLLIAEILFNEAKELIDGKE
jgi:tetratricopeptide (TPR) repeat protein